MKILKLVLGAVVLLVLVAVVAVGLVIWRLDAIAKQAIEAGGTRATGVATTLDQARVSVLGGSFSMAGLTIANPAGFTSPHFFHLGNGSVSVSLGSLLQETVRLPELSLTGMSVNLERSGEGTNVDAILQNLKRLETSGGPAPAPSDEPAAGKTFVIDRLVIDGVVVRVSGFAPTGGAAPGITVNVPPIQLTGVGSKGALTTAQLVDVLVKTVLSATIEAGGANLPDLLVGQLKGRLAELASLDRLGISASGGVGDIAGSLQGAAAKALEEASGKAKQQVDDAAEKAKEQLRGLLGGDKGGSK